LIVVTASPGSTISPWYLDSEVRCVARSLANFGIEAHWQLIDLAWIWFRRPHFGRARRMMQVSKPPT